MKKIIFYFFLLIPLLGICQQDSIKKMTLNGVEGAFIPKHKLMRIDTAFVALDECKEYNKSLRTGIILRGNEISDLKGLVFVQKQHMALNDSIYKAHKIIISNDSTAMVKLNKSIKWVKLERNVTFVGVLVAILWIFIHK